VTYIIYSQNLDRFYVGHTEKISVRINEHNSGISTYTAKANDWVIKLTIEFQSRAEAKQREMEIKKKKSRKYIEWLILENKF
jgi:putative endonuclease